MHWLDIVSLVVQSMVLGAIGGAVAGAIIIYCYPKDDDR